MKKSVPIKATKIYLVLSYKTFVVVVITINSTWSIDGFFNSDLLPYPVGESLIYTASGYF